MAQSRIEWTEATWNPSVGCKKVSSGCANCYAEVMARRLQAMRAPGYEHGFEFRTLPERLDAPRRIKKPTKFFVNSMSDLFHKDMPFDFLDAVFKTITETPQHTYQILTKRDKIMVDYFLTRDVPNNVWLGVSVESRKVLSRIDSLRRVNANIRFLSVEPLLENLGHVDFSGIHWVIVGGESGVGARPMKREWALNVQRQCDEQDVAFFFKQWGAWGEDGVKRSKKANGRLLDDREWNAEPLTV